MDSTKKILRTAIVSKARTLVTVFIHNHLERKHIMKTNNATQYLLSVVVTGLFLAAIIGCQDPSVTTPVTTPDASVLMKPKPQPAGDMILLDGILRIPGRTLNAFASIKGEVRYSLMSTPYRGVYRIDLNLATNATIVPEGERRTVWNAAGESHDQLFVSEEGIALLEKFYAIEGARDRMILHVRFLLTSDGIGLSGMWLEMPKVRSPEAQTD